MAGCLQILEPDLPGVWMRMPGAHAGVSIRRIDEDGLFLLKNKAAIISVVERYKTSVLIYCFANSNHACTTNLKSALPILFLSG